MDSAQAIHGRASRLHITSSSASTPRACPSPTGRRWPEGPDEGRSPSIGRRNVVRRLVPSFSDVILLPRIDPQMLTHPFHILKADVVILAQRETDPVFRQQDAPKIGMVRVTDAEHVVDLAFQPVRRGPNARDALDLFPF